MANTYKGIKVKNNYDRLLASGMFWVIYPELTGIWSVDKPIIFSGELLEEKKRLALNKKFK